MAALTPTLDRDLRFAIVNKRLLQLIYSDKVRVVEPHDYGVDAGVVRLLAYQIEGATTAHRPSWRLFDVAKIERCRVLDRGFPGSRGQAHRTHKIWDEIFVRVG